MSLLYKIKSRLGLTNVTDLRTQKLQLDMMDLRVQKIQEALGRIESRQLVEAGSKGLQQNEFKVYSQWGEDGIIQNLLRNIRICRKTFIEFGVENYTESNTRYLLVNNNWSGLVIDGSPEHVDYIKQDRIYWQHNLKAECSFITKDNINSLFEKNGIQGEIGLLSVDIDGNDYWVWDAIDSVNPAIVVVEYNARFGPDKAVTIPYDANFVRSQAHYSGIYYGASLRAFWLLGKRKGYVLVGCNTAGNNAFFVRKDLMVEAIKEMTPEECYVKNQFREARNEDGSLAFSAPEHELKILESLPWVDISE